MSVRPIFVPFSGLAMRFFGEGLSGFDGSLAGQGPSLRTAASGAAGSGLR
ncbi:MAG: hypothetical protein H6P95_2862 [Candidatus Aminicenantes bacterium]|nr:hypothetical protein [Candidatus Aminicenantes bacterium]